MKKKLKRQIIELLALHRMKEGDQYFDPKVQRAIEGVRGHIASIEKRLSNLEPRRRSNVIPMKRRRA